MLGERRASARSGERWSCCRRKKIRGSADRDEADSGGRDDVMIGLDDGCSNGDRFGGRCGASGVTGSDTVAALRVTRVSRSLPVVLMLGHRGRLYRAGVQPLHRTPADPRGEKHQGERQDLAASEQAHHGGEHSTTFTTTAWKTSCAPQQFVGHFMS
jgi:hypothetical protein